MSWAWGQTVHWTSDEIVFWALQLFVVGFVLFAALLNAWHAWRAGRGSVTLEVKRSPQSMNLFYGMYAAITGVLVALCLQVNVATHHRVIWVLVDTLLVAYLCLRNAWFRNKLVGVANALASIERR